MAGSRLCEAVHNALENPLTPIDMERPAPWVAAPASLRCPQVVADNAWAIDLKQKICNAPDI
ncbi:hypothetical protein EJ076_28345 [Mesorhizobium sp. M7D.F.Ca.US.005.01.1.1]|uniref:hypothetical protein n=1 Tax=Mesorhizobium sp. M7D.F.Ca.US.005.01.1.1 TaxID=2493678 RepID=UPI000F7524B1|nr:hypothetical protein [Mesorhizobium sp. M7D.F.Ca.US.005.01.1.1]AZO44731.1 hypothetical protein EJ076_28345 [Mesorhizobium sp. M7D.F.Ca.US.005.01.1.1]